jgi:Gas vesicle synthesis protein GvpL/GvpF
VSDDLRRWAASRADELIARAEAEAVAELKAALLAATSGRAQPAPPPPSPPEPPRGHGIWAYCVARAGAALEDIDEAKWLRDGDLALLYARVPLEEFGEEPLRRNLNDLPWLERTARAHEAVIATAFERSAVVPLRLCTLFAGAEGARRMLAEQHDEFAGALDALSGREEWSVKLIVDPDALAAGLREPGDEPTEPGTGAAYLLLRREERRLREAVADRAAGLAEDVHARLQERAVDARVRPAQNRELAGYEGEMVLNGAYLVERDQADGLRALVAELEERHRPVGARIELGGPFPPYSFVPESE